jgi:hypothetical protein
MTSGSPRPLRTLLISALVVLSALSLSADQKKRGVQRPPAAGIVSPPPVAEALIVGSVVDAVTNTPVINADVSARDLGRFSRTDAQGVFRMTVPANTPVVLRISRFGYQPLNPTLTVASGTTSRSFSMTALPAVVIRTVSGAVHQVASDTVEFGYLVPFGGFIKDRIATMCKGDGTPFTPQTNEIKRVAGPAVVVANSPCCSPSSSASGVMLEMRNGENLQAFFADSCFGYAMEVIGLDQAKATLVDIKLTEVSEIVFP